MKQQEEMLAVLNSIDVDAVDWLAVMPERMPTRLPDGRGLVLSPANWFPPKEVEELVREFSALSSLDLRPLAASRLDYASLRHLLRQALEMTPDPFINSLSDELILWLNSTPKGRVNLLAKGNSDYLEYLLKEDLLALADLPNLAARLSSKGQRLTARQLASLPDGLDRFLDLFGSSADGLDELISDDQRETLNALAEGHFDSESMLRHIPRLYETGLLGMKFPLRIAAEISLAVVETHFTIAVHVLTGGGIASADTICQILDRRPMTAKLPPEFIGDLVSLAKHSEPIRNISIDAVNNGWPVHILGALGFSDETLALVDDEFLVPPAVPPSDWSNQLTPLLRRC